jgi:UDP-N-acetylmuramoyl-tripeptide--D-alanyl-D-alanine ligase
MRIKLCEMLRDPVTLAEALQARLVDTSYSIGEPTRIRGIATDSREVERGDLFVALKGEREDGAAYVFDALSRGAIGILSAPLASVANEHFLQFTTDDPVAALTHAAAWRRHRSDAFVIAVGGSTGKTTTKEALSLLLSEAGAVARTEGNYNSTIGLPLTMLSFKKGCRYWVSEIGINHVGEMEGMAQAVRPDLAILTNVGTAHIGHFGDFSTLLCEKAKIASALSSRGLLLAPAELPSASFPCSRDRIKRVGNSKNADFYMENVVMSEKGIKGDLICPDRVITNLNWSVPGVVGLSTLTTVAAAAVLCGCSDEMIRQGLEKASQQTPRLHTFSLVDKLVIDDTYNASPESVAGALEVLSYRGKGRPRVAVLGDMLELGAHSEMLHQAVGEAVAKAGLSMLFTYGDQALHVAKGAAACGMPLGAIFSFGRGEEHALAAAIRRHAPHAAAILFKASGKMKLGKIVEMIGEDNGR